jgi:predicted transcriptional regulator of viral defense system
VESNFKLNNLLDKNKGIIRTAQALEAGLDKPNFYKYIKDNKLERVSHGIYATQGAWIDELYILHLRSEQAIFSHDTALLLHGMTDREPAYPSITVKTGYNPSHFISEGIKVYTVKHELLELGKTTAKTQFGHTVPVYDIHRTICDIVRSRNKLEFQTVQNALKAYVRRKDKNLNSLMQYASMFGVQSIVRGYMELLVFYK